MLFSPFPTVGDSVHGKYHLYHTLNVDSVPMTFTDTCKITIEREGAVRVSMIVPGGGLDKRVATLHLVIRPKGEQPWPTLILNGGDYRRWETRYQGEASRNGAVQKNTRCMSFGKAMRGWMVSNQVLGTTLHRRSRTTGACQRKNVAAV
jgi:hypothetical protein